MLKISGTVETLRGFVVSSSGGGGGGAVVTADTLTMAWPGQEVAWSPASCLALVITTP